jgi:hypothetical protein
VNEVKRWWENDPTLCTCYSLLALDIAYPRLEGAPKEGTKPEGATKTEGGDKAESGPGK